MSEKTNQPSLFDFSDDGTPVPRPEAPAGPKKGKAKKAAPPSPVAPPPKVAPEPVYLASTPASRASSGFGDGPLHRLVDENFLQYASYVIRDRAIPSLEDGLKPVQRRILHSLHEMDDGRFIKVANVVGHAMKYHPHGDASIGDALVALVNRGYLIEGQGNFGNIYTGDGAAAPRYIECRLTDLAASQVFNKDLTEYVPSYDARSREPVALPCKIPLLLLLGAEGIAVGLSTKILPHNFAELLQAQIAILRNKPFTLLPDFPQGGLLDARDYDDGKGRVRVRAAIDQKDETTLVVRDLPYGVTTETLIASVEAAAKKGKFKIRSIHDYTAGEVEIEIKLPADAKIAKTIAALYAFTSCEVSITLSPVVIRDHRPVEMGIGEILRHNTARLVELLKKELELEHARLLEALQATSLVRLFITKRIYKRIEECKTQEAVFEAVLTGLEPYRKLLRRDVTDEDVKMLLGIPIRRISLYDIEKSRQEEDNLLKDLAANEKALANVTAYAIRYLKGLLSDYGRMYPRKTRLATFDTIALRALEARPVSLRRDKDRGYIGTDADIGDVVLTCSSLDKLLLLWDDGRYKVIPVPEKLFVDKNLLYAGVYDRDRTFLMVYTSGGETLAKKFAIGGAIANRDYESLPEKSRIIYLADNVPERLYLVYAPKKGQQIRQQAFETAPIKQHGVKSRGVRLTLKKVSSIGHNKPRNWQDKDDSPPGTILPG